MTCFNVDINSYDFFHDGFGKLNSPEVSVSIVRAGYCIALRVRYDPQLPWSSDNIHVVTERKKRER